MYCENCGAILTGGGKFCPECGAAVNIKIQNQYKKELEQGGTAFAYLPDEDTIRAVQAEVDRPSKAGEYKKTSTDWRDHVDSDKFREQNANGQPVGEQHFSDQPFYDQTQYGSGERTAPAMYDAFGTQYSDKSYVAAALLAFFLGAFGAHNFYLGYKRKAIIQLVMGLMTIFTLGISGIAVEIWAFVEFILLLTGSISTDGDGRPLKR